MPNAFVHTELTTSDPGAAKKFYKALFDWKLADMPMGPGQTYTMIDVGKKDSGGGIQAKPMPEAPVAWLTYVEVASVAKTLAKAEKLGGKVLLPLHDIGMGKIGIFCDPQGAALGIWEPAKAPAKKPAKKASKKAAKKAKK